MNELMRLDLPAPVAPAISTWGMSARLTSCARPWTSLPSATASGCSSSSAVFERRMSPSITKSRTLFGTSTPIAERPGIGAMIRTSGVASAYAMSSASESTLFTFVPASISTSYRVTVGPRCAATTWAGTPNVWNVRSSAAFWCSSSRSLDADGGEVRSSSSGGSS